MGGINISELSKGGVLDIDSVLENEEEKYSALNSLGENVEVAHDAYFTGISILSGVGGFARIAGGAATTEIGLLGAEAYHNYYAVTTETISDALDDLQHQVEIAEESGDWNSPALAAALEALESIYPEQNRYSGIYTQPDLIELVKKAIEIRSSNLSQEDIASISDSRCFAAGTMIDLGGGKIAAIETLKSSDEVACFDPTAENGRGALTTRPIVRVYENVTDCFIRVEYPDGRDPMHVTPGHRVLDETGGFTKIGDLLRLGNNTARLIDVSGEIITVTGKWLHFSAETAHLFERATSKSMIVGGNTVFKEEVKEGWKTYNFEVAELHTYIAQNTRVHNDSGVLGRIGKDIDAGLDALFGGEDGDGTVRDALTDIVTSPLHAAGELIGGIVNAGAAIVNGFSNAADRLNNGDVIGAIGEVGRGIGRAIGEVAEGVANAIGEVASAIGNAVNAIGNAISDIGRSIFGGNDNNDGNDGDSGKPIILDLDGDGVEINVNGNVSFDMDGDGFLETGAWADADDGFLVIDLNADGTRGAGDGVIDQTKELVLTKWLDWDGATDLQALATFDQWASRGGNNDGVLDAQDSVWNELKVWQDVNQNSVTDEGELKSLTELGITQINLTYDDGTDYADLSNDVTIMGNTLLGSASYTRNGEVVEGGVGDVALSYNAEGWRRVETDAGYNIEFEAGTTLRYAVMDGTGSSGINANTENLDGVMGDARDNNINASNHTRDVALSGGDGNDSLKGGYGNDKLAGGEGADTLKAAMGNDLVFFDAADVVIDGGWGYDTAVATGDTGVTLDLAAARFQVAHGTDAADSFDGGMHESDIAVNLHGKGGNDTLRGSNSDDLISGDAGNDKLEGSNGDDMLLGGSGDDKLYGHSDDDVLMGGSGNDTLDGSSGDDMLIGGSGSDSLKGGDHDDYLDGGDGADNLDGGEQDDIVFGGNGDDTLKGGGGDDVLDGGEGHDVIYTGKADDLVRAGSGNDTIHIESWGDKRVEGGDGNDSIHVSTNQASHEILGGKGRDKIHLTGNRSDYKVEYVRDGAKGINQYRIIDAKQQVILAQDIEAIVYGDGDTQWLVNRDTNLDNSESFHRPTISWGDGGRIRDDVVQLTGSHGNSDNYYRLRAGDDAINMAGGNDTAKLDAGDDYALLGTGNDQGYGGSGNDALYGESGADTLKGESGADGLDGGAGNDVIEGSSGADVIQGGTGDDTIKGGSGADVITGDGGNDSIEGGTGSDFLSGGDGADTLKGQDGTDRLDGGKGNDTLYGGDGSDRIKGGEDNDKLYGELGDDALQGEEGDDYIDGGRGNDILTGGDGNDELRGSYDFDQLDGGAGNDTLRGGNLDDLLIGGNGDDKLYGDQDNDVLEGGGGADFIDGGSGIFDLASYASSDARVEVNLKLGTATGGHATGDVLTNIEWLAGGEYNDRLDGDDNDNRLYGAGGDDGLYGKHGRDVIYAGDGDDYARGDQGDDNIYGEDGDDRLDGNDNNDILSGGRGNDQLWGKNHDDRLYGDVGDDRLTGGRHNDELTGGAGDDVFIFAEDDGTDVITDFENGTDVIEFTTAGITFASLTITDTDEGAQVTYDTDDTITLTGIEARLLTQEDFIFV